jgi:hypothetical protein
MEGAVVEGAVSMCLRKAVPTRVCARTRELPSGGTYEH